MDKHRFHEGVVSVDLVAAGAQIVANKKSETSRLAHKASTTALPGFG